MKKDNSHILIGGALLGLSALFLIVDILVFHDKSIYKTALTTLAFMFIQVLLVTYIIDRFIGEREKRDKLEKLKMVIGVFFNEAGTKLLAEFSAIDPSIDKIRNGLVVTNKWGDDEFATEHYELKKHDFIVAATPDDLARLREYLAGKRDFLLRILENQALLEHEAFTELMRAVFHLLEELVSRDDLAALPRTDVGHIEIDIKRAYALLADEWLDYMKYLKSNYPYLFSHAVRTNPFDAAASPVVTQ